MTNELVLIGPKGASPIQIENIPAGPHIAMGFVEAVPAGRYGKAGFEALGVWERLQQNVVQTDSARAALALVARGEVPFGVVYLTDALAEERVDVIAVFPAESHPRIIYEMVLPKQSLFFAGKKRLDGTNEATKAANLLVSDQAKAIYAKHGFGVL